MAQTKPAPLSADRKREQHRMAAIRRCNDAILSLRSLTDVDDHQERNDHSSEALLRLQHAIAEVESFRSLIYDL